MSPNNVLANTDARRALAAQQEQFLQALTTADAGATGIDPHRLHAAVTALADKRRRSVQRAWPMLTHALGPRFDELFPEYARAQPLPKEGGPLADGRAFADYVAARMELPEEARSELLSVDLRFVRTSDGLAPRRGFLVKFARMRSLRRLIVCGRLPWTGAWWWEFPLVF